MNENDLLKREKVEIIQQEEEGMEGDRKWKKFQGIKK